MKRHQTPFEVTFEFYLHTYLKTLGLDQVSLWYKCVSNQIYKIGFFDKQKMHDEILLRVQIFATWLNIDFTNSKFQRFINFLFTNNLFSILIGLFLKISKKNPDIVNRWIDWIQDSIWLHCVNESSKEVWIVLLQFP